MGNFFQSISCTFRRCEKFIQEDVWLFDGKLLSPIRRMLYSFCRICLIVIKGYRTDACSLQASALTYITLVSLVPVLAIMFSFSKGIGMQKKVLDSLGIERVQIESAVPGEKTWEYRVKEEDSIHGKAIAHRFPEPMQQAILRIFNYVENTNFAALGLIGSIALLIGVIMSMSKLEKTFNTIWGIKTERPFIRKVSEYLVFLLLVPFILVSTTSLNTLLVSNKFILYLHTHYTSVASLIMTAIRFAGWFCILIGFGFFYMFMPNTRVKCLPALLSGIIAGVLWYIVQWVYLYLQVGLTNFNKVYGTFAVVPFFLAWLYANWSIILFGAEMSFALQNHKTIHLEKVAENLSTGVCLLIAQLAMFEICKEYQKGSGGWRPVEYAQEHNIPIRILRHVLNTLMNAGVILQVKAEDRNVERYVPGKDPSLLSPAHVEEAFRKSDELDTKAYLKDLPQELRETIVTNYEAYRSSLGKSTFAELLQNSDI